MLYLNKAVDVVTREFKFGAVNGITLGEHGRGRQQIFLPAPKGLEGVVGGLRIDLTIGLSKAGKPRINRGKDKDMYLALSSERGYTRRGNGVIKTPVGQEVELIARGNGADGDAGRIGYWDVVLVKANERDVFRVTWGGSEYNYEPTFYVVHNGQVFEADQQEIEELYESLGLKMPFSLTFDKRRMVVDLEEWKTI
jgi:hypothetical protein